MSTTPVRIAIIGCGAIAEQSYLPILAKLRVFKIVSLVDSDLARARTLAQRFHIPHYSDALDETACLAEAAIIAVPNSLHHPVSCHLMAKKLHVFCEKPLATSTAHAEQMVRCARENGVVLAVGNVRRYYWTSTRVKEAIDSSEFGSLLSFHIQEGLVHNWPTTSGFYFDKAQSGGGVLIDLGAHVLDLLLWWLQDYPTVVRYQDDNFGGVEAECELELRFAASAGGRVKLSRLRKLNNRYSLVFRDATIVLRPSDPSGICNAVVLDRNGRETLLKAPKALRFTDYFQRQLKAFADSIRSGLPSPIPAASILPSIRLIEECYRKATRFSLPWLCAPQSGSRPGEGARRASALAGAKILITGAAGFIGGRIAERLCLDHGNTPRCLVKNYNKLARLSRLPVEVSRGDVLDYASVLKATSGCDVVIHCAYGNTADEELNLRINTEGTENVIRAALESRVERFVHLSTVEVYGRNQPEMVDETTEPVSSAYAYGRSKLEAEKICQRYFRENSLPLVILRLAFVYGPYAPIATVGIVNRLLNRGFCASEAFNGLCNPVYVDDCVDAAFLAITRKGIIGETFIISGGETLTWNDYYGRYNQILGMPPVTSAGRGQLRLYWLVRKAFDFIYNRLQPRYGEDVFFTYTRLRERREIPNLKSFLQKGSLLEAEEVYGRKTYYSIEKARKELGFQPKHTFDAGLMLVKQWLEY